MQSEREQTSRGTENSVQTHLRYIRRHCQSSYTRRYCSHPFWRVAEVEQLRLPQSIALLLPISGAAACPGYHDDTLDVGRIDKKLHLDARALHHVPEDERRVGSAASHRDEHAGESGRCVREVDREHGTGTDALGMSSRKECGDEFLFFRGRECSLEICHETLALAKGYWG